MNPPVRPILHIDRLPFTIGVFDRPVNPDPFPGHLPMDLAVRLDTGCVIQVGNQTVREHLDRAYRQGSLLGTAMDDTAQGRRYADDFIAFLQETGGVGGRSLLEIGAGRGYLLSRLQDLGAEVLGVEPGRSNAAFWARHGVPVVQGYFPEAVGTDRYDRIVGFALLEHVEQLGPFLAAVRQRLSADGAAVFAVPDCGRLIADGDPSMLLHEHWHYFTESSLPATLALAGLRVTAIRPAGYGAVLYVAASPGAAVIDPRAVAAEVDRATAFAGKYERLRAWIAVKVAECAATRRTLGVYVPGRALALLPPEAGVRFFDDDAELHGKYFPPFSAPVESRNDLLARPVDELWILSWSFGPRLAGELARSPVLAKTNIMTIAEIAAAAQAGADR